MFTSRILKTSAVMLALFTICLGGISGCATQPDKGEEKAGPRYRPADELEWRMEEYIN